MSARLRQAMLDDADAYVGRAVAVEKTAGIGKLLLRKVLKSTAESPVQKYLLARGIARETKKGIAEHRLRMEALRRGIPVGMTTWMKPRR
jgi:hypothetical protein